MTLTQQHQPREASNQKTCASPIKEKGVSKDTLLNIRNSLKKYLRDIQSTGVNEALIDMIAIETDTGLMVARNMRDGYPGSKNVPKYFSGEVSPVKKEVVETLLEVLAANSTAEVLNYLKNSGLPPNAIFPGDITPVFLMEYLVNKGVRDVDVFHELLANGYKPQYSDLVAITLRKFPLELVEKVHYASGLSAKVILGFYGSRRSLVNYAISTGNYELARYWWQKESPLIPDVMGFNALDLLARYQHRYNDTEFNLVAKYLLENNINPNFQRTKEKLLRKLSPALVRKFRDRITYDITKNFTEDETIIARKHVRSIFVNVLKLIDIEEEIDVNSPCLLVWGGEVMQLIKLDNNQSHVFPRERATRQAIVDAISTYDSDIAIEQRLGGNQSAYSKGLVEEYRHVRQRNRLRASRNSGANSDRAHQHELSKVLKLAQQNLWEQAVDFTKKTEESLRTVIIEELLNSAINENADEKIVNMILEADETPPDNAILGLILTDNAELAKKLLDNGLNLYYLDSLGFDALTNSVRLQRPKMFGFLIKHKFRPNTSDMGPDALDFAIDNFSMIVWKDYFIYELLKLGLKVELSHKQRLIDKSTENLGAFLFLSNKYPQLASEH